jgi:hypothetical protein
VAVDKMSVSLATSLSSAVREAAEESGETLSGWLADAAETKLRARALDEFLDVWENENGSISEEEIQDAASRLGVIEPAPLGWFKFLKVTATRGSHEELVTAITRVIESGRSVLIPEHDVPEISQMMKPGGGVSFEKAEIRVRPLPR